MNPYIFHISLYDLAFLGAIFIGLFLALQLVFTKGINRAANRYLSFALVTMALQLLWLLGRDVGLSGHFPHWSRLPLQFSLAVGPFIFFYVLTITRSKYKFRFKDLRHFSPLLLQVGVHMLEVSDSIKTGAATYETAAFRKLEPLLQLMAFVSVVVYLYLSRRLIGRFYQEIKFTGGDRQRYGLRWLDNLLIVFGALWLLWIPFTAIAYFYYHNKSEIHNYFPLYLLLAVAAIRISAVAFLRPGLSTLPDPPTFLKPSVAGELKQRGSWLKKAMKAGRYYQDPELSLVSLAEKLDLTTHELSRIINTTLKKSFNDFINEYRVQEAVRKMQDPANDHITLLGIAFESGFNSQSTFGRAFRQMTGKSPQEYKNELKKQYSSYNLTSGTQCEQVILLHETPKWFREQLNYNFMFKNYFKTAWRNLFRNKFYSFINIAGLTAGLAIGILILLWVQDELSFDSFHKNAGNIYRVELFGGTGASKQIWEKTVAPMGPLAKQELPEVQDQVRITPNWFFSLYKYKEKVFGEQRVAFADPSLFSVFDFPLVEGNNAKPFANDNSVVITKKTAQKFFGAGEAIGKVIVADGKENFTVSGVINDFPLNSSINFDMIMPMSYHVKSILINSKMDVNTDFNNYAYETYFKLKPGASLKKLSADLFKIHIKHRAEDTDADYLLLPINKMHLYNADGTDRGIQTVRIFIIIALVILLIACINYVNLSTARSLLRAKEISMRKIIGAGKLQLFIQFLAETALLFLIATIVALIAIYLLMPVFNHVAGKQLVFSLLDPHIWLIITITVIATLALSSIYPAMLLSSFEPLKALKGKISGSIGDALFRKILVVVQFTFSVVLIVSTLVITRQLKYIQSKNLGYDKSHVFSLWMRDAAKHYDAVKAELLKQPGVEDVTRATGNIISSGNISGDNSWDGKAAGQTFILHVMGIDKDFINFFKLKMQEGSSFSGAVADSTHFILNEAAVREIGMKNPIGKQFRFQKTNGTIIGVVKDFHFASLREKIAPAIFFYRPAVYQTLYIKTSTKNAAAAIAAAGSQFKQYNGQYPFSYSFLDDIFNDLYQGEQREGTLFNYFAGMAILISCLGLLGLAAYTAQVRTREIGVRKVLGASVTGVIGLLAKDFIKLVLIAIVVATPVAWYAMTNWLDAFAYRIPITWTVFVLAACIAIVIAFVTISFQSIKAALANPVKSLRSE